MAKPTKYATPVCLGLTVLAAAGILGGVTAGSPLITMFALVPAIGYEVYRTEGESTRWASWALLVTFIATLVFLILGISFDLAGFFGESEKTVAGYQVPLGDIRVVGSALMIVLSVILFTRTRGVYTRWLSAIIFVSSFAVVYILAPGVFQALLRFGVDQVVERT